MVSAAAKTSSDRGRSEPRLLPGLSVRDGYIRHPFDLEFGVRTSGLIAGRHLVSGNPNDRHSTAYYGIAPSVFRSMLVRWRRCRPVAHMDEFTFVDLGAGMGRAVLLAAEYPFRAVIGVELHPTLARIARRNMAVWRGLVRARAPMRLVCIDAGEFDPPPGPCVAFLFNPFGGPVLRRVLARWVRAFAERKGQLDLLYVNNEQEQAILREPGFIRLFQGQVRRSHADMLADRRILTSQPGGEYAATPWEDCSIYRWTG